MKIAQIAPLYESVPPKLYGGTERVVAYLTDQLVQLGHDVTLFASGDSQTGAKLISACEIGTRLDANCRFPHIPQVVQLEQVQQLIHRFDVLHFHTDAIHLPLGRRSPTPAVTTLHGRLDLAEYRSLFRVFHDAPLISISNSQREPIAHCNFVGTVPHGLPEDLYNFESQSDDYVLFLGRISPEKRPDRAVRIAKEAGMRLKVAAKIETSERRYYESDILPLFRQPHVEFLGEVGESEKRQLLGKAKALLFPIDWPEPFGLVMIEALACGTPVIAFRNGAVPEVIRHGQTGFVVDRVEDAVTALNNIDSINRSHCRLDFERRFSSRVMAQRYVQVYKALIADNPTDWSDVKSPTSDFRYP